ncbi:GA module-containing protein [Gardnerella sp. DNF00622A]
MTDAEELRELIKKLSEAKHADPTYNSAGDVVVDNPATPTEDDFKKAVEAFVKVNYDNSDKFNANTVPTTLPTDLTPKSGTVNMEIADDNIKSVTSSKTGDADDYKSMVFKDQNGKQLFAVAISYKKKEETPKLSDDELKEMRKQAKETIDRNPNLTKKDKEGFDTRIDKATNAEDIQKILKEAAEKANQNSTSNDPKIKGEISGNQNGTDAENQQKLDAAKEAAKKAIDALTHLSEPEKKEFKDKLNGENVKTPADVQKIVDAAKLADELKGVKEEAQKATFVFLDHGTGDDKHNTADTHTEDAALNELLGGTPAKDPTLAALEAALAKQDATADEIKNALDAAKLQNTSNEQNAKNAGIAKLDAKKAELDAAYKALPSKQQESAKTSYEAATKAIDEAKTAVNNATKPSEIKKYVNGVDTKIDAANGDIKKNTPKRDTSSITNDQNSELNKEKEAQKKRINGSDLPDAEKQKAIKDIEAATMLGDPTGIANRYLKAQKIEDAKKQIAALEYLNKAQKQYYKDLLDSTDASDHVDEAGKPTGKDDIDDALEQALNLNGVMKRLADLATSADELKKDDKDKKYSSADNDKKSAFDAALKAANTQLDKVDGADSDNINADGANALYGKLLEAMKALDNTVKDVDLYTSDLQKEYKADLALKEKPVYKNATKNVKEAFDKAFEAAKAALDNATKNPTALGADAAAQQNAIGAALANLVNTRKALDGIDTTALQAEVDKDKLLTDKPVYKNATENKKTDFDKALAAAEDAIADAEGKKQLAVGEDPKTQEQKQKAVDAALTALQNAAKALDGKEQKPTPAPSVDKTGLRALVDAAGQVKDSDAYKYADADKQGAYDKAISDGQSVLAKTDATADEVTNAVNAITTAKTALDGKKPTPTPTPEPAPTPTPSVDKSHLQQGINGSGDVKKSDDYNNAPSDKRQAYDHALDHANEVNKDPNATQDQVNQAVEDLKKAENDLKPTPTPSVDKSHLQQGINGSGDVKKSDDYTNAPSDKRQAYDHALDHANEVNKDPNATQDQVNQAVEDLKKAENDLKPTPTPSVDKSHLQQGINGSGDVKKSDDYTNAPSDKKQSYDHALDHANEVNNNPNATQDQVNQATEDLKKAEHDLKPTPNPLPTPGAGTDNTGTDVGTGNTGSGSEAGYGVNDNAPTTVDKGELNIQIDSAEADSKPGNAGDGAGNAGNAGAANANAGSAPNAQGGAGAQGAGAGTGNTGAANAGVDNKAVNNAVENSPEVKQADAAVKQAAATLDEALTQAKRVAADPHATQAQVDAAAVKLADARKAFADAQANAAKVRAAVRSRVIKGMRSRGNAGIATGANVATTGLMATMIAAIGGAFVTRRMRAKHANRD